MIKKGYLFGLAVFCSLFVLVSCKATPKEEEPKLEVSEEKIDCASLMERGFVPKVVRLGDSYINDRIESKAKKLSYEYYYFRVENGGNFDSVKEEDVFAPGKTFHTATIDEADAGDASKTKLKYEKIAAANGGEVCIGTRFVLGLRVIDQSNNLVSRSMSKIEVRAPQAGAKSGETGKIYIPGDQRGFDGDIETVDGGTLTKSATKYENKMTVYTLTGASGKRIALKFGDFGETNKVLVQ